MKFLKKIVPCPVCNKRDEYNAYKDIKEHANGWKNKFTCSSCKTHLIHRNSVTYSSVTAVGFTGFLHFADFEYSAFVLVILIIGMFYGLYSGLVFKAVVEKI